ncbi:MAG: nuclear transport factor 2 family protein [Bacteroidetes bacterium]|nr:nuclear transport factor 2 family protein [Bacteroidota bacterium]MCL5034192.1 nuclear transport factor 2 family protein [Bacteroidota bacterium]
MESDREEVLRANRSFYRAFEDYDISSMQEVWSNGDYVRCTHPGWKTLIGWSEVRQSWEGIFSNPTMMKFELHNVQIDIVNTIALVSLIEEITSVSTEGTQKFKVVASNVFEQKGARWQMILHHGSGYTFPERSSHFN